MSMFQQSTQIGRARFSDETTCIYVEVRPGGYEYEIDLERCQSPGACLDWFHQLNEKNWGKTVLSDFASMLFIHIPTSFWASKG